LKIYEKNARVATNFKDLPMRGVATLLMPGYIATGSSMSLTYFTDLRCSRCRRTFSPRRVQSFCPDCTAPLVAVYDLAAARSRLDRDALGRREGSLWRYRELLPVEDDANIVSLGEGWTPLIRPETLSRELGVDIRVKEEGYNPTGSFKARGLCLAVAKAKELGIREVAMPSAGNAGGALAAYAAKAGIRAHVFVPADTPRVNIREVALYGADVVLVEGVISDAAKKMQEVLKETSWFDLSTMKEPYRLEGKKTMGYELAEQYGWELPDVILYPTGGGTGLIGMWKAFQEMEELGWISGKRPRMVSVQADGCAPIVRAFAAGERTSAFWERAATAASGLRVPKAFADAMILDALYESGGTAVAVSDEELLRDMRRVAASEGIFLCPEGAAAVSGLRALVKRGAVRAGERIVVFNTGSGYKYTELYL
jgi:threonine synthase